MKRAGLIRTVHFDILRLKITLLTRFYLYALPKQIAMNDIVIADAPFVNSFKMREAGKLVLLSWWNRALFELIKKATSSLVANGIVFNKLKAEYFPNAKSNVEVTITLPEDQDTDVNEN